MKIWTDDFNRFGKTLIIIDQKVAFDKKGCAEVEEDFGKKVLKIYKNSFFKEEQKFQEPVSDITKSDTTVIDNELVDSLKQEIEKYKDTLTRKRSEFDSLSKEFEEFKINFDLQQAELKDLKDRQVETEKVSLSSVEEIQMKYSLALKGLNGCKSTCKKMSLPEEEYKEEKDLEKLIEYIISKAK